MNPFIYHIPTKVYFGEGQLAHLGKELAEYGDTVCLVYGGGSIKRSGLYQQIIEIMRAASLSWIECSGIEQNPRITSVRRGADLCKENHVNVVLAVGGGSVIDAAKNIAAAACCECDPWDFLTGKKEIVSALPIVTVLTIAATGSEMDNEAVVSNVDTKEKLFDSADALFPKVSFLDPTLTYTVNPYQTACGCADILSHIMEVYFNTDRSFDMVEDFMEGMMRGIIKYAPIAMKYPDNYEARANLMWTASWAINGFISRGMGHSWSCHPMEHELSAFYDIVHGLGLAILITRWMEYCLKPENAWRYAKLGVNVFGLDRSIDDISLAKQTICRVKDFLYHDLNLCDTFTGVGIDERYIKTMAVNACRKGNGIINGFVKLAPEDVEAIYRMCL